MENHELFEISEVTISYKSLRNLQTCKKITSSIDAFEIGRAILKDVIEYKEFFYIILLNNSNKVLGVSKISEGTITGTLVDVRLVFQALLKSHATSFICFHNHPSGTTTPSEADKQITKKLRDAGELLDIKLLDHLIITPLNYTSFADESITPF